MKVWTQLILRVITIGSSLLVLICLSSSTYALPALTGPQSSSNSSPNRLEEPNSTSSERLDSNQLGIVESKARVALTIVDQKNRPLEKARVILDGKEAITDKAGLAIFTGIKTGRHTVAINKDGKITNASINIPAQKDISLTQRFTIKAQAPSGPPYILLVGILVISLAVYIKIKNPT